MNRLLKAEMIRLVNSFVFKLGMLFSGGLAVFIVGARWLDVRNNPEYYAALEADYASADAIIFIGVLYLLFAFAVEVSVFIGTEYSDGTIRNKLIAGRSRTEIYFSEFFVCVAANLFMYLFYLVLMLGLGGSMLGIVELKSWDILKYALLDTAAVIAFTALLTAVTIALPSKASGAIVCLLMTLILLLSGITISQNLSAPEYYDTYEYVDEETGVVISSDTDSYVDEKTGEVIPLERKKNYHYVAGTKRKIYTVINELSPVAQLFRVGVGDAKHLSRMAAYDGVLLLLVTGVGVILLERKNIK